MTSMITGLPDRYRPLDEVGPEEVTPTGVIRCWRAKDRVLNRDVAIRVHTPGGPPAHAWIARALTAGGLATPALAMVYDAAEGDAGEQAAYVVNEWIEGETLAHRLTRGPMPEREIRTMMRRLADGVAEAHRAGLALGGLTPDRVVLRPNGLVGVRAVPAATGTVSDDITALGALLEACLTGRLDGGGRIAQADLAALVRRARSTEPGQSLSSAAAMATLLAERPRSRPAAPEPAAGEDADAGWLRRLRERRNDTDSAGTPPAQGPRPTRVLDPGGEPAEPAAPATTAASAEPAAAPPSALAGTPPTRTLPAADLAVPPPPSPAPPVPPTVPAAHRVPGPVTHDGFGDEDDELIKSEVFGAATPAGSAFDIGELADEPDTDGPHTEEAAVQARQRRRLLTIGMPILALAVIIGLAWWLGTNVLSVAGSVDEVHSTPPSSSASASSSPAPPPGQPVAVKSAAVYDPFGDGQPENNNEVPQSFDGNPATAWHTLEYRSAALGNLKPGVGVVYDLGSPQALAGATITTTQPGATMEVRVGDQPRGSLDSFRVAGSATLTGTTDIRFTQPVTGRYVLIWFTKLPQVPAGFQGDVAELVLHSAR